MDKYGSLKLLYAIYEERIDLNIRRKVIETLASLAPDSKFYVSFSTRSITEEMLIRVFSNLDLEERKRMADVLKPLFPDSGLCERCGLPFMVEEHHSTDYGDEGKGCFCLCEKCWSETTIEERLEFYKKLWESWKLNKHSEGFLSPEKWQEIEKAVLSGK